MASDSQIPPLPEIPPEALRAIIEGIENDDPVCNLEPLGISQRTINLLEKARILTLEDLMYTEKKHLMALENLGPKGLIQIFEALAKYHEFEEEI